MALHVEEPESIPEIEAVPPEPAIVETPNPAPDAIDERVASLAKDVRLSPRERIVLRLIAQGYRYREIGTAMSISPRTVKMYATNLRKKVGGTSRWDLMRRVLAA